MTTKERIFSIFLIFLCFGALFLSFLKIRGEIYKPFFQFSPRKREKSSLEQIPTLKNKDTDQDGLSDFEEVYIYKTSSYLEDTDGDGYSDKTEVENKTDPLCPEGQACQGRIESPETETSSPGINNSEVPQDEVSLEEIRQMLSKAGIDKETLEKIDDQTLKELYQETIKETGINPKEIMNLGMKAKDLKMNASEIRKLLIDSGIEENLLNQVDDKTLEKMFLQAIGDNLGKQEID